MKLAGRRLFPKTLALRDFYLVASHRYEVVSQTVGDAIIAASPSAIHPRGISANVYGRGSLFIEDLSQEMGDDAFAAFLWDYYQTYQWGIATMKAFRLLPNSTALADLTELFEAWVY